MKRYTLIYFETEIKQPYRITKVEKYMDFKTRKEALDYLSIAGKGAILIDNATKKIIKKNE